MDKWWTYPAESEDGQTILITGRDEIEKWQKPGKFPIRVTVSWDYTPKPDGMPSDADADLMEQATDALLDEFRKDKAAVMTGIYTGAGRRDWVFYTHSLNIFGKVFNRALAPLPELPLKFEAAEDPDWEEYRDMREATYVPDEE
ncbi:MAG: DUF695 domain-containing protein [Bacteroides sp.]|nr:DUF695 domain-containing protein [Bacteroides sp.]MBD5420470.1 DUF695 domain-containing protein [Bacteroides sp.]MDE6855980.1 DUF695 domain-containing protein [Muribaculaceae bacterium]